MSSVTDSMERSLVEVSYGMPTSPAVANTIPEVLSATIQSTRLDVDMFQAVNKFFMMHGDVVKHDTALLAQFTRNEEGDLEPIKYDSSPKFTDAALYSFVGSIGSSEVALQLSSTRMTKGRNRFADRPQPRRKILELRAAHDIGVVRMASFGQAGRLESVETLQGEAADASVKLLLGLLEGDMLKQVLDSHRIAKRAAYQYTTAFALNPRFKHVYNKEVFSGKISDPALGKKLEELEKSAENMGATKHTLTQF